MQRTLRNIILATISLLTAISCCETGQLARRNELLGKMRKIVNEGKTMYGHHDTYLYGHDGWKMGIKDSGFDSDIYQVCGKFPAVFSSDLGMLEFGESNSLDNNPFELIRRAAIRHNSLGGIVTFSWHPANPLSGGNSWDCSASKGAQSTVKECLPGGSRHSEMRKWLKNISDFFESLKDADGNIIAFIFRPWHENTGDWFWWGASYCSDEEYIAFWKMTYEYMVQERGLTNIVWAYSPGNNCTETEFMNRYPGDEIVDVIGFDSYEYCDNSIPDYAQRLDAANREYIASLRKQLEYVSRIAEQRKKILALTECGFEGVPYPKWWTEVLCEAVKGFPVAYILNWRNACDNPSHFYGPWKGAACTEDFINFAQNDKIVFLEDLSIF